jgi:hypothetical protein
MYPNVLYASFASNMGKRFYQLLKTFYGFYRNQVAKEREMQRECPPSIYLHMYMYVNG